MKTFDCKMCGHCCHGEGGIILKDKDLERLSTGMNLSCEEFASTYAEHVGGRLRLKVREDGYCIFFNEEISGCGVHLTRPDVCRAWPFFRGNIVDSISWELSLDYCPGLDPNAAHSEFAAEGIAYLKEEGLVDESLCPPNALNMDKD